MAETMDVRKILLGGKRGLEHLLLLRGAQAKSGAQRRELEGLLIELMENPTVDGKKLKAEEAALVIGTGLWALGRLEEAIANLVVASSPEADCVLGRCYLEAGFCSRAAEAFERAQRGKAATKHLATLGHAEATAKAGRPEAALTPLRAAARSHPKDPAVHYLLGLCNDHTGRYEDATGEYEKALELDHKCDAASFRLGFNAALRGHEDRALEHYSVITAGTGVYLNALINLGVLHEDRREFDKAVECYRRVLRLDPNHARARMFLKDAHSSLDMVYDEDHQRELDRKTQLLGIPVTDFELSVRVRNCLQRMDINTLGELVHHTEEELLASKNFGETSLQEIKEMLAARGLHLGMEREEEEAVAAAAPEVIEAEAPPLAPPDEAVLDTAIAELDLSLRSRKCMERLGITTIGQLVAHTPDELLSSRNFGRTSLVEVNEKLTRRGLALTQPPEPDEDEESDEESDESPGEASNDAQ